MLIQPHDRDDDPGRWRSFVTHQGFGHLVASGTGRDVPVVSPTQFVLLDDEVLVHVAAPNPILRALAENPMAVLSVAGDWTFIPGEWKAIGDEDPARGIPTTYYAAVQIAGRCQVVADVGQIADILRSQLGAIDPDHALVDPAEHGAKLQAIRGIRLAIDDVRAKYKFGGNVDQRHRDAVEARLLERDGPGDRSALAHLRRT